MIRGAATPLGQRVVNLVVDDPTVTLVEGSGDADIIVDLLLADHDHLEDRSQSVTEGLADLIDDLEGSGATHLVVVSSAMVYGAWPNNPVPLTESAVLRPDPEFVYARQLAGAEELIEAWRQGKPDRRVAVLRPAIPIALNARSSLATALTAGLGERFAESDADVQFVHLDDLASAVALAVRQRLDGAFNVAPDSSVAAHRVRDLSGPRFRLPLPEPVAEVVASLRWKLLGEPLPLGARSYIRHSWLIANDRLRSQGWKPTMTNEQAYVEGTTTPRWSIITPQRRQEIALGVVGGAIILVVVAIGGMIRRWLR